MKIGQMFKLGFVLAAFATAACVGLAFVYAGTAEVIATRSQADLDAALKELFPSASDFREITGKIKSGESGVTFGSEYEILRGGAVIGVAIRCQGPGFNGFVTSLVGVGADGKIAGAKVLEHSETPGLGANAASPTYFVDKAKGITFMGQFTGMGVNANITVDKDGGDVVALTAATITSRGLSTAVRAAGTAGSAYLSAQGGNQ